MTRLLVDPHRVGAAAARLDDVARRLEAVSAALTAALGLAGAAAGRPGVLAAASGSAARWGGAGRDRTAAALTLASATEEAARAYEVVETRVQAAFPDRGQVDG